MLIFLAVDFVSLPTSFWGYRNDFIMNQSWFGLSTMLAIIFYMISLEQSMKEKEQWLHSPASVYELLGVKVMSSLLLMFVVVLTVGTASLYNAKDSVSVLTIVGGAFVLLLNAIFLIAVTTFYWALLEVCKSRIGKWAWPLTLYLFVQGIYVWFIFYVGLGVREMKEFRPIGTSSSLIQEESALLAGLIPSTALMTMGSLLMYIVLIPLIFISSAWLFEKKVRL